MKLIANQYGKAGVRVMKVLREGSSHFVKELNVEVALSGEFETAYTAGKNSQVVPTDTIKNTINVLAMRHLGKETERFSLALAKHFLDKYPQVSGAEVLTQERLWNRLELRGEEHPHSFAGGGNGTNVTRTKISRCDRLLESGVEHMLILKSTGSGFEGYPRCEYTTLPETKERILATALEAVWTWSSAPSNYAAANAQIVNALLEPFTMNYSPSMQTTLFQMGESALAVCEHIVQVHLEAPNKHCLLINLKPFNMENNHELFVPTDEPAGQITATIRRE